MDIPILYDDPYLLLCCKRPGSLSEPHNGAGLPELLAQQYRAQGKPDFISGVHRLDRNVGGVMVFSRKKSITGKLIAQVTERSILKEYVAILRGRPTAPAGVLEDLLFHDRTTNKTYCVKRMRKGVRPASLEYTTLAEVSRDGQPLTLVRIRLHTGRTHQIRVQFASRGTPLLGDIRYGSRDSACDAALWAFHLRLTHPVTGKPVEAVQLPPMQYPWDLFPSALWRTLEQETNESSPDYRS